MYDHKNIEKKWQNYWEENNTFVVENNSEKPPYYVLDMFPYPSGAGLHVGHPEGYTANDIVARYKNAKGFNVLHPMGWDAFGLPAENYAIKTGTHPRITTDENIQTFKRQIKSLGISYDWNREIDTTDPKYFKWTQWIFLKLFEAGLAYEQDLPINYCPSCKTWLANEEVLKDNSCERCGNQVEKKKIRQWVLAITKYADRLAADVEKLDWPEGIKEMQRNWIGRSEGCEFEMKKAWDETKSIRVYTTRVDTVYGMTYAVVAPDHPHVEDFIEDSEKEACQKYIEMAAKESDQERTAENKEKTWVFTGSYVMNPYNNEKVPVWIADYVLGSYGTWAIMAVPWHDERDFAFAKKYDLPISVTIFPEEYKILWEKDDFELAKDIEDSLQETPFTGYGYLYGLNITVGYVDSEEAKKCSKAWKAYYSDSEWFNEAKNTLMKLSEEYIWLSSEEAQEKLIKKAEDEWFGEKKVNYKLRDWLFSRQRYWGEPIPLIHLDNEDYEKLKVINDLNMAREDDKAYILDFNHFLSEEDEGKEQFLVINKAIFGKIYDGLYNKIVCDYDLPLKLPEVEKYEPAGDGNSPLTEVDEFVNVKLAENLKGTRETNTMPQWWGSCWYYLRFMDPHNDDELVAKDVAEYWGAVDSYVGGAEHAVLHLLYARFWHKFLYDEGVVPTDEPFQRLRNQGMILAYAYEDASGKLISSDLVTSPQPSPQGEGVQKYFHKETGEELKQVVAKMSKSLKNVVNPDDIIEEYGADSLRLYEMYMADFKDTAPWDTRNILWVRRFLDKVDRAFTSPPTPLLRGEGGWKVAEDDHEAMKILHKTIKKVGEDIENYKFNTAIAQMMILVNYGRPSDEKLFAEWRQKFAIILAAFAPHMGEELWEKCNNTSPQPSPQGEGAKGSIFFASWPEYDEAMVVDDEIMIGVQVLGKLRGEIQIGKDEDKDSVLEKARTNENVAKFIEGKQLVKEIYVPGRIVNLVVK